jgi:predicted alpha/beta superfamily hydrolase
VWRAERPLIATTASLEIAITNPLDGGEFALGSREVDGLTFPLRREIRAEIAGGDGVGEMTFALRRASRPAQLDYLGTDDNAPYRVFWSPSADMLPEESFEVVATFSDLRGRSATASVGGLTLKPTNATQGIAGSKTPTIKVGPQSQTLAAGTSLTLRVEADGSGALEYQWLRDGEEIPGASAATYSVESATAANSGTYRVLVRNLAGTALSDAAAVSVDAHSASGARTVRHSAFSSRHVAARHVDVWLPPGYDADSVARYPVIYMHDGQNLFDPATSFGGVPWSVDSAMERLMAAGRTRGAIVVGIWNTGHGRFAEYMPRKPMTDDVMMRYGEDMRVPLGMILSDAYLRFLVEELKPFIDHIYRTLPEREHTFTMGSSMGGLISAYALVEYPEVFGGAGCVSTHWPAGEGGVIDYIAKHLPPAGSARLYCDHGTGTLDASYEAHQSRLDGLLRAAGWVEGRDWITRRFPGAEHSEKSWRERVDIPLAFLLDAGK